MTILEFTKAVAELQSTETGTTSKTVEIKISDKEYKAIETVYMYHPAINEKKQIAELYLHFGMPVIYDMLPRANKMREAEVRLRQARIELEIAKQELEEIRISSMIEE